VSKAVPFVPIAERVAVEVLSTTMLALTRKSVLTGAGAMMGAGNGVTAPVAISMTATMASSVTATVPSSMPTTMATTTALAP
jgi:hypothetical protein